MRLIDADKLNEVIQKMPSAFFNRTAIGIIINGVPEEAVRCKDCKYFEPDLIPIPYFEGDGVCFHEHWKLEDVGFEVMEIDFCSYGERKEEND